MSNAKKHTQENNETIKNQANPSVLTATQKQPIELDVRINSISPKGTALAIATVSMNGCFLIRNVTIRNGKKGLFISLPRYQSSSSGKYREHCYPITKEFREHFINSVIGAYQQAVDQSLGVVINSIQRENAPKQQTESGAEK